MEVENIKSIKHANINSNRWKRWCVQSFLMIWESGNMKVELCVKNRCQYPGGNRLWASERSREDSFYINLRFVHFPNPIFTWFNTSIMRQYSKPSDQGKVFSLLRILIVNLLEKALFSLLRRSSKVNFGNFG